jgi:hypothetical protein
VLCICWVCDTFYKVTSKREATLQGLKKTIQATESLMTRPTRRRIAQGSISLSESHSSRGAGVPALPHRCPLIAPLHWQTLFFLAAFS